MIHPIRHVHRRLRRLRRAMWLRRHYRVCANCRYYETSGRYDEDDRCTGGGWTGDVVTVTVVQPGCERWRRKPDEPEFD